MSSFLRGHKIVDLVVESPDGKINLDLRLQKGLISFYEDVTDSSVHLEVDIQDTYGFLNELPIRSGSKLYITIEHSSGEFRYREVPFIISDIKGLVSASKKEMYTLVCETQGSFDNHLTRVYKKYKGKISNSVRTILTTDLGISQDRIFKIDETVNEYDFLGNYRKPLFAITWLCPKSRIGKSSFTEGSAGFLFYETQDGYNFRSIDNIFSETEDAPYFFYSESSDGLDPANSFRMNGIPKWNTSHDLLQKLRRGAYKSSNAYFDINTRRFVEHEYDFRRTVDNNMISISNDEANIPENFVDRPSRRMLSILDQGTLSTKGDLSVPQDQPFYQSQAAARYSALFSQSLNITVPMNLSLRAGQVVKCEIPKLNNEKLYGKNPSSGYYMIKSLSHKFGAQGDITALSLVRDSYSELL